jgi:rhamnosyltransferase subunit B
MSRPLEPEVSRFLESGPPPVLLTPGSANMHAADFLEAGLEACRRLGLRALVVTPFKEQLPKQLPAGSGHFDFVAFSLAFPRCAAVVHHGGIGTCAQGMAAGVPQLIMAMAHDQPDNGWRLRHLGVGDYLYPRKFTAATVTETLHRLTNSPAVGNACCQVRERMREQMPAERVAELLEQFAARKINKQSLVLSASV